MIRALSIMQPWAYLVAHGHKDIENRDWRSFNHGLKYRGLFLIHAGKKFDPEFSPAGLPPVDIPPFSELQAGGIVGIAEIMDCVTSHKSPWFFGPYGFVIKNAKPVRFIPLKGQLGFFNVPPEVERAARDDAGE